MRSQIATALRNAATQFNWDWDYALHVLGGLGLGGLFCLPVFFGWTAWIAAAGVPLITAFGYLREKMQHDFNRLSQHQWIEAITWGIGALLATSSLFFR